MQEDAEHALELDAVVETIHSPEQLFAVLNEQLSMVQDLSDKIHDKHIALQHSEEARHAIANIQVQATEKHVQFSGDLSH